MTISFKLMRFSFLILGAAYWNTYKLLTVSREFEKGRIRDG